MKCLAYISAALLTGNLGLAAVCADEIGDKAKPLEIAEWVKGKKDVDVTDGKSVYVVEFWATWCGPCIINIPHLTDLQKEYGDKVVFIGISKEEAEKVKPFVEKQGDKMDYTVALDKEGKCHEYYMKAYGQKSIPCAFIIDKEGSVAWVGHPMKIDEPLKQIVEGTYDFEEPELTVNKLFKIVKDGVLLRYSMEKYMQAVEDNDQTAQVALEKQILEYYKDNPDKLLDLSMLLTIKTKGKCKEFSIKLIDTAEEVIEKTGQTIIADRHISFINFNVERAFVCYQSGDIEDGDLYREKAISEMDENRKDFHEQLLEYYRKMALEQAKASKN